jgi:hypothetical protein
MVLLAWITWLLLVVAGVVNEAVGLVVLAVLEQGLLLL